MAARPESNRVADLTPRSRCPASWLFRPMEMPRCHHLAKVDRLGAGLKLPAAEIQDVKFREGRCTYLSELDPLKGRGDGVLWSSHSVSPQPEPDGRANQDER